MTLDLDNLRKLEAAATPGPWEHWRDPDFERDAIVRDADESELCELLDARDAALIAAMRNALPALLADHARLGADVADHAALGEGWSELISLTRAELATERLNRVDAEHALTCIAKAIACEPESNGDIVEAVRLVAEAVRLLVAERDTERDAHQATREALAREQAEVARLTAYIENDFTRRQTVIEAVKSMPAVDAELDAARAECVRMTNAYVSEVDHHKAAHAEVARLRGLVERACTALDYSAPDWDRDLPDRTRSAAIRKEAAGE